MCMSQESVYYPPAMGALTPLYAGTMPEGLKMNGKVRLSLIAQD